MYVVYCKIVIAVARTLLIAQHLHESLSSDWWIIDHMALNYSSRCTAQCHTAVKEFVSFFFVCLFKEQRQKADERVRQTDGPTT